MKGTVLGLAALAASALFGYEVSVDTMVANPGGQVAVPVRLDTVKGLANAGVRVSYDPQVLVFIRAEEGTLTRVLADDYIVLGDNEAGTVSVSAFGVGNATNDFAGTLTRLVFAVRDGTAGRYSDLAVTDVQLGEKSGVKDVTVGNPLATRNGMVRVMAASAAVERLDAAETVVAGTRLDSLKLEAGDAVQASDSQTNAVVVSGAVTAAGAVSVAAPVNGWANGRYVVLVTPTEGLSLSLRDLGDATATCASETSGGMTTYYADVTVSDEIVITCEDEVLDAGSKNQIRALAEEAGLLTAQVREIRVSGPAGRVALIADMGIAPSAAPVDANGVLNLAYAEPKLAITAFDPKTGAVRIKVTPGEGNRIAGEIATGYLHVYGTDDLARGMSVISQVGFDLTPYLKEATKGEAILNITLGTHTFLQVKIERFLLPITE